MPHKTPTSQLTSATLAAPAAASAVAAATAFDQLLWPLMAVNQVVPFVPSSTIIHSNDRPNAMFVYKLMDNGDDDDKKSCCCCCLPHVLL